MGVNFIHFQIKLISGAIFTFRIKYEYTQTRCMRAPDMSYLFYLETLFSVKDLGPHQLYHNPDMIRNEKRDEVWDEVRQLGFHIRSYRTNKRPSGHVHFL